MDNKSQYTRPIMASKSHSTTFIVLARLGWLYVSILVVCAIGLAIPSQGIASKPSQSTQSTSRKNVPVVPLFYPASTAGHQKPQKHQKHQKQYHNNALFPKDILYHEPTKSALKTLRDFNHFQQKRKQQHQQQQQQQQQQKQKQKQILPKNNVNDSGNGSVNANDNDDPIPTKEETVQKNQAMASLEQQQVCNQDGVTLTLVGYKGSGTSESQINQDRAFIQSPFLVQQQMEEQSKNTNNNDHSDDSDHSDTTTTTTTTTTTNTNTNTNNNNSIMQVMGVMDGHGHMGEHISQFCADTFPLLIHDEIALKLHHRHHQHQQHQQHQQQEEQQQHTNNEEITAATTAATKKKKGAAASHEEDLEKTIQNVLHNKPKQQYDENNEEIATTTTIITTTKKKKGAAASHEEDLEKTIQSILQNTRSSSSSSSSSSSTSSTLSSTSSTSSTLSSTLSTSSTIIQKNNDIIKDILSNIFLTVNATIPHGVDGGCTASILFRHNDHIFISNVGDSKTFVFTYEPCTDDDDDDDNQKNESKSKVELVYQSREDKPHLHDEKQRIQKCGGTVHEPLQKEMESGYDSSRVIVADEKRGYQVSLAMSRSLGDWNFAKAGVIAEPIIDILDLNEITISSSSSSSSLCKVFAVSATDGLLDYVTPQEMGETLAKALFDQEDQSEETHIRTMSHHSSSAMEDLILRANYGWFHEMGPSYRDDIAITAMKIHHGGN
jgi:hypothetical protein